MGLSAERERMLVMDHIQRSTGDQLTCRYTIHLCVSKFEQMFYIAYKKTFKQFLFSLAPWGNIGLVKAVRQKLCQIFSKTGGPV